MTRRALPLLLLASSGCVIYRSVPDGGPGFAIPDAGPGPNGWSSLSVIAGQPGLAGAKDGVGVGARLDVPAGIAVSAAALYFADSASHDVRWIDLDAGAVRTLAGTPGLPGAADGVGTQASFDAPAGVALVDGGVLFVADSENDAIRRVDLSTLQVTTFAGGLGLAGSADGIGTAARFLRPSALAFDGAGALWVADTGNDTLRRIDLATAAVTTVAGSPGDAGSLDGPAALFRDPAGVAADPGSGTVWVADTANGTVREIVDGGVRTLAGVPGDPGWADGPAVIALLSRPTGLCFSGGTLYVADTGNAVIRAIDLGARTVATVAGVPSVPGVVEGLLPAGLDQPQDVALSPLGQLYISDVDTILEIE
ncbi:MAG: NHL repeat-containing protein [Myxococcales bacterium]